MKFALIGHPVAGSLSPLLFGAAYSGRYQYDLIDRPSFDEAWEVFLNGYDGINVTAPFKQDAFSRCLWLSPAARLTGAVNLVLKDGLRGYNTDVDGILYALAGCPVHDALVVGTGGAARAAIAAALQLGCRVFVLGRSPEKVAALEAQFGLPGTPVSSPDLVIYTLPGSAPVPSFLDLFRESLPVATVLEANYRDPRLANLPCRKYISGVRWLLGQAVAGYSLFTGERPSEAAMKTALEQYLQEAV